MDANKGRFAEIFPVVTTVYKSTSHMDFVAVLLNISEILHNNLSFLADSGAYVL